MNESTEPSSGTSEIFARRAPAVGGSHHQLSDKRSARLATSLREAPSETLVGTIIAAAEHDRRNSPPEQWKEQAARLRKSELGTLLAEDPFTEHALRKPRGYAGDAALLDRIYFGLSADYHHGRGVSALGRVINAVTVALPAAEAVRARRVRLARAMDEEADRRPRLRVASIACGYLREANLSRAFADGRIARLTCVDQDPESTRDIAFRYERNAAVVPVCDSITRLIDHSFALGEHDFIYSAGLYDYLPTPAARALTERLFAALAPGGRLLIGNYAPGMPQQGYMEAFVDWWLIYRSGSELREMLADVPNAEIASARVETCETGCVHYLDVRKRPG
jgi:hypothetical protein